MLLKMVRQHLSGSKGSARLTSLSMAKVCTTHLAGRFCFEQLLHAMKDVPEASESAQQ